MWDKRSRTATCESCVALPADQADVPEIDRGRAGASARREWAKRHDNREQRIRKRHKRLGGLILATTSDPASTAAWAKGAHGEETIGRSLDLLREEGFAVLHDRRIPGSKANIDHIVVGPAGIFLVDPKNYRGKVEQRAVGGWFNSELRLYVDGRNQSKLIGKAINQADAVRDALASSQWTNAPITPTICFMQAENWSLLARRPLRFGQVYVLWGKALGKLMRGEARLPVEEIARLERALALALPPA
jgi:hypothetical protein